MSDWLGQIGLEAPRYPDLVSAFVAILVVALAWGLGLFGSKKAGPFLAHLWERHAGSHNEGIADRMCKIVGLSVSALVIGIAIAAETWRPLAQFLLGVAVASWVALLVREFIRGLNMPRWVALLLATVAFVALLAQVLGGLAPVTAVLDKIGFTAGKTRFSLLTVLQIAVALLVLFAVVRLASRFINHSIAAPAASTRRSNCSRRSLPVSPCSSWPSSSASTLPESILPHWPSFRALSGSRSASGFRRRSAT